MKKLLSIVSLLLSFNVHSAINLYVGAGQNFSSLGALRVGTETWEVGRFAPGTVAINLKSKVSNNFYAAMGVGAVFPLQAALVAAAGFEYELFWGLGLRGELHAVQGIEGVSFGAGTLGGSFNF